MTTLQNLGNISKEDASILIEKYLDLIEDLEDYVSIENHKSGKTIYLSENQTNDLFSSLMK